MPVDLLAGQLGIGLALARQLAIPAGLILVR
jgi:hypothetical protein